MCICNLLSNNGRNIILFVASPADRCNPLQQQQSKNNSYTSTIIIVSRKADLRELKVLQKIEKKQYQDLMLKAQYVRDQQMKKFEQEMQVQQRLNI